LNLHRARPEVCCSSRPATARSAARWSCVARPREVRVRVHEIVAGRGVQKAEQREHHGLSDVLAERADRRRVGGCECRPEPVRAESEAEVGHRRPTRATPRLLACRAQPAHTAAAARIGFVLFYSSVQWLCEEGWIFKVVVNRQLNLKLT
jgi:hypothetical protein